MSAKRWWPKALRSDEEPVAVLRPEPLAGDVRTLLAEDEYVQAVRLVRRRTHLDLLPAALAVNALRDAAA